MYKAHKQYYIRSHQICEDNEDSYKKQYEKGQEQRAVEAQLAETISEYFEIVTEYHILAGEQEDFKTVYESIFTYVHPKPPRFTGTTSNELETELNKEEERLNKIYTENFLSKFNAIQDSMK
jgi:hypothetical protein